jgi:competence protein ComEA
MKKSILTLVAFLSFSISAFAAVNINTATQAELESLQGVGPVKAQAIIDYRKKNGGFKSVDDIKNVDGIGDATLEKLRKDLSITGQTSIAVAKTNPKENKVVKVANPVKPPSSTKSVDVKASKEKIKK